MPKIGDKIRSARDALGISQQRLAEQAGCSIQYLQGLECGRSGNPGVYVLRDLARALDVTPSQLVEGLDERP